MNYISIFYHSSVFFLIFVYYTIATPAWTELSNPILLVRLKRNANRALTYSAFNPNGGMAAFTSSSDFLPHYYRYLQPINPAGLASPSSYGDAQQAGSAPASTNEAPGVALPPSSDDNRGISVSADGSSANGNGASNEQTPNGSDYDANANSLQPGVRKGKKKPTSQEDDEEYEDRKSGKSAFNAWFPIMLNMHPSGSSGSFKDSEGSASNGKDRLYGATIIANSVSNGRSGVAHAIAYGGGGTLPSFASVEQKRTFNGGGSNGNSV